MALQNQIWAVFLSSIYSASLSQSSIILPVYFLLLNHVRCPRLHFLFLSIPYYLSDQKAYESMSKTLPLACNFLGQGLGTLQNQWARIMQLHLRQVGLSFIWASWFVWVFCIGTECWSKILMMNFGVHQFISMQNVSVIAPLKSSQ